ncbi:SGNH hydrolase [Corynespora cassiicola Philippines]|uniref:SGNH hydrolase n=1 Tax=Corynespora cassiicola Philippines TaxID=1448308 RepID=A0A2T2NH29_CORCC|nr:SGNH hydrolase [Corynespora cassiicola Philippines]
MRFALVPFFSLALASPILSKSAETFKPIYWLLAGDSTTAPNGGWGDAFLSTTVVPGSSGHNYGHGGASTASFRAGGDWANIISDIRSNKDEYDVFVTIQFGHNDQKNTSGVSLAQYKTNLATFASEVNSAGGTPILVTPLTRRTFSGGKVIQNLEIERTATIDVAKENCVKWIDLNLVSTNYVNAIGQVAADSYNWRSGDRTHLNAWGGIVFSRIVSDLIVEKYPKFIPFVSKNETLSATIKAGEVA